MPTLNNRFRQLFPHARLATLALSAFSAWCAVCGVFACGKIRFSIVEYAATVPMGTLIALVALLTAAFFCLGSVFPKWLCRLAPLCALFYGAVCCYQSASFYTAFGFLILLAILLVYVVRKDRVAMDGGTLSHRSVKILLLAFGALMAAYLITAALMRYLSYNSPCYDFGIFAQMFHNMRQTGLPVTTCEREVEMSHFAVHVSPIYYLLLPFYMIAPRPETLLVLQVLAVLSSVIPLYLLARHHALSARQTAAVCLLCLGCAALTGGIFYDFHENKFLTALILWLMWAIERKKFPLVAVFTVLTLAVKEDAALYVIFIGLWLLLSRPEKKTGAALTVGGTGYFLAVTAWLNQYGDGAMFNRFSNLIGSEGGIGELVRTMLINPALLLHECMTEDKLIFAACVLLPLGLLPFFTKKLSSLILLCPFVIVNLLSDYTYQHSLNFQYTYGMMALLFYLTVANLPHVPDFVSGFRTRRFLLCFALCAATLIGAVQISNHNELFTNFNENRDDREVIAEVLEIIPDDTSVRSSSMFVAHLSARNEIYYLTNEVEAAYVVLDLRPYINISSARGYDVEYFERLGYRLVIEVEDVIAVLKKP